MKEISFIANNLNVGGSQKVLISLANEAIIFGYKVNIISLTNNLFLEKVLIKNINLKIYKCTNSNTSKGIYNRLNISYNLFKHLIKLRPKFIHSHLWQIDIIYLLLIKYFLRIKILHTIHSPGSSYLKINNSDYLNNYIEKKLVNSSKKVKITLVSNEIIEVIKKVLNFNGVCKVIPNGVELPKNNLIKKTLLKKDKYSFIFPARFQESKGHKILLDAFKMLVDDLSRYDLKLILVGTDLKENLFDIITDLNLTNHVIIRDPVVDIYNILSEADFGVFPSLYEGHSIALCEMMAIGLPIVATNISSNLFITENGQGAILCNPNSSIALFNCMKTLVEDIGNSNSLSIKAQEIINTHFSEKTMFLEYEKIYSELQ